MKGDRTATIQLPPDISRETRRLARARGVSESVILRSALRRYRRDDSTWSDLLAYGRRMARAAGIRTEGDVERLVDELRS